MTVEGEIRRAILDELNRQAENSGGELRVEAAGDRIRIDGPVDIDDLVMVVLGSVAGGP